MAQATHLLGLPLKHKNNDIIYDSSIIPLLHATIDIGTDAKKILNIWLENELVPRHINTYAGDSLHWFQRGFFNNIHAVNLMLSYNIFFMEQNYNRAIIWDETNKRFLFYIDGSVTGYIDSAGFHNGPPP